MPFGVNVAGDVFQHKLDEIFGKLTNVMCIVDDIMVAGYKEDHSDHDLALTKLLQTAQKNTKAELWQATVQETWSDILWWELNNPRKKTRPKKLYKIFGKLTQVMCTADDIMVVGYKEDHSDHDLALTKLLQTAQKNNVNLQEASIQETWSDIL